jgi:superfamily II DNA/RNA helicase
MAMMMRRAWVSLPCAGLFRSSRALSVSSLGATDTGKKTAVSEEEKVSVPLVGKKSKSKMAKEADGQAKAPNETRGGFFCYSPKTTFADLGMNETLVKRTAELGLTRPSSIQERAIPVILGGRHDTVVVGSETGSGKTMAFVLPVLNQLMELIADGTIPKAGRGIGGDSRGQTKRVAELYPHAIFVVPTTELAHQLHGVLEHLITGTPLTCGVVSESRVRKAAAVIKPIPEGQLHPDEEVH